MAFRISLPSIPPLPSQWPYVPRVVGTPQTLQQGVSIPSVGEGWTLYGAEGVLEEAEDERGLAFGRGGIRRLGEVVLRPYRRGGLFRHLNERTYPSPERFVREFMVHRSLWALGFPTVEPLGYGFRRRGWGYEGVFLTKFVEAAPWPMVWDRSADVLPALHQMLEALAAWGLHAPDLNATNILLDAAGNVLALDWDKSQWVEGRDLMACHRARLVRSLCKLGAPREVICQVEAWGRPEAS